MIASILHYGLVTINSFSPELEHNTAYNFLIFFVRQNTPRLVERAFKASVQVNKENLTK